MSTSNKPTSPPPFLIAVLIFTWLVAGCAGNQTNSPSTPLVAVPQATGTQPKQTAPEPEKTKTATAEDTADDSELPPIPSGCTVVSKQFAPEPTLQSLFPAANDGDWSLGPGTAAVTIIEYGDFQ